MKFNVTGPWRERRSRCNAVDPLAVPWERAARGSHALMPGRTRVVGSGPPGVPMR